MDGRIGGWVGGGWLVGGWVQQHQPQHHRLLTSRQQKPPQPPPPQPPQSIGSSMQQRHPPHQPYSSLLGPGTRQHRTGRSRLRCSRSSQRQAALQRSRRRRLARTRRTCSRHACLGSPGRFQLYRGCRSARGGCRRERRAMRHHSGLPEQRTRTPPQLRICRR